MSGPVGFFYLLYAIALIYVVGSGPSNLFCGSSSFALTLTPISIFTAASFHLQASQKSNKVFQAMLCCCASI